MKWTTKWVAQANHCFATVDEGETAVILNTKLIGGQTLNLTLDGEPTTQEVHWEATEMKWTMMSLLVVHRIPKAMEEHTDPMGTL